MPTVVAPAAVPSPFCVGQAQGIRVLLVEPEKTYREPLVDELSKRGIAVRCVDGEDSAVRMSDGAVDADVILAGWGMPKMSSLEMWGRLRRTGVDVPLVLLAGRALSADDCLGFDPDAGRFMGRARGVDALARRLRVLVQASRA
jgi:DNA-binding response OmpR family regulator